MYSFAKSPLWTVSFNHKNNCFACGGLNGRVYFCSTGNCSSPLHVFSNHKADISHLLFSQNDLYLITADTQGVIRLTNVLTGECERLFLSNPSISCIALCLNDSVLAVGSENGSLSLFEISSSKCVLQQDFFDVVWNNNNTLFNGRK